MNTSLYSSTARTARSSCENYYKYETNRLSKDVDMLTRKLEQERRRNVSLDNKVRYAVS